MSTFNGDNNLYVASREIWVTFQKEAIHRYPAAETEEALKDVSFLQYPHRHILHFRVQISVANDDRDIEFILFKRWLLSLYDDKVLDLDYKSMEMIANDLAQKIGDKYRGRTLAIDVSEDGENGASMVYHPER